MEYISNFMSFVEKKAAETSKNSKLLKITKRTSVESYNKFAKIYGEFRILTEKTEIIFE